MKISDLLHFVLTNNHKYLVTDTISCDTSNNLGQAHTQSCRSPGNGQHHWGLCWPHERSAQLLYDLASLPIARGCGAVLWPGCSQYLLDHGPWMLLEFLLESSRPDYACASRPESLGNSFCHLYLWSTSLILIWLGSYPAIAWWPSTDLEYGSAHYEHTRKSIPWIHQYPVP